MSGFDHTVLAFWHSCAESLGFALTPVFSFISFLGMYGWTFVAVCCALIASRETRTIGLAALLAIALGTALTELLLKGIFVRPRPYMSSEEYLLWWQAVGSHHEDSFSFPSGHTTATAAFLFTLAMFAKRPWAYAGAAAGTLLMGASRTYLMVHYPTDIIGGFASGLAAAIVSYTIVMAIKHHREAKWLATLDE